MTNDAFFGLDVDDAGLNEMVHDATLRIYLTDDLTVVAHHLRSDEVIWFNTCKLLTVHSVSQNQPETQSRPIIDWHGEWRQQNISMPFNVNINDTDRP